MRDINCCSMHCAIVNHRAKLGLPPPNAPEISIGDLTKFLTSTSQSRDKFAAIVSQEAERLLAMARYEQRALFRRKIAIKAFDEAQRASSRARVIAIATR
jgi:hypothetical protein